MKQAREGSRFLLFFFFLIMVFLLPACVPPAFLGPPLPPFSKEEISTLMGHLTAQASLVTTLFCTGTLTSTNGAIEQEANITIVGKRSPFQVKMEITHPWGSPVANLLIDNDRFTLVFFPEKRIYSGSVEKGVLRRSFPVPLTPSAVWGFVRGYPPVPGYEKAVSPAKGVIHLLNGKHTLLQRLELQSSPLTPRSCSFPAIGITQYYSAIEKDGPVEFARKVILKDTVRKKTLTLQIKRALFNPRLPSDVFQVAKPENFKAIDLSRENPQQQ